MWKDSWIYLCMQFIRLSKVFQTQYKISRFLQFWFKLNIYRIVKTCLFLFPCDYDDSPHGMFLQFPNHFLTFPMVFPHVSPSVSTISGVSTVSPQCFPPFLFQILRSTMRFPVLWKSEVCSGLCSRSMMESFKKKCNGQKL